MTRDGDGKFLGKEGRLLQLHGWMDEVLRLVVELLAVVLADELHVAVDGKLHS